MHKHSVSCIMISLYYTVLSTVREVNTQDRDLDRDTHENLHYNPY